MNQQDHDEKPTGEQATIPTDAPEAPPSNPDMPPKEKTMGMVCHLAALAIITSIPFANIIGPLIVWLIKKDEMPFVDDQGKEAINFQITISLAIVVCAALFFLIVPIFLIFVLILISIIFSIIGGMKANNGEYYRYPFALRLIK